MTYAELNGVEIFRTGTWNGKPFTNADLDSMAQAANEVGYIPPVKLGHTKDPGAPALGWVKNVRREGSKLLADFKDVPDQVYDQIKKKSYDQNSIELYEGLERDGKKWPLALKAVAILGADVPAVSGLKPLSELALSEGTTFEKISIFGGMMSPEMMDADSLLMSVMDLHRKLLTDEGDLTEVKQHILDTLSAVSKKMKSDMKMSQEAQMSKEHEDRIKKLEQELEESKKSKDFSQSEEYKKQQARLEELETTLRNKEIADKVSKIKIPGLRAPMVSLYSALSGLTAQVDFAQGDKTEKITGEQAADKLVAAINVMAEKLFKQLPGENVEKPEGSDTIPTSSKEAGEKLTAIAEKLAVEKKIDFNEAWKAVKADKANAETLRIYTSGN